MNSKTIIITLGTVAIAAVALLFASGPITGNQQVQAQMLGRFGGLRWWPKENLSIHNSAFSTERKSLEIVRNVEL